MHLEFLFELLYPIVPIIAVIGYGPQIYKVLKATDDIRNFSLLTWSVWLGTWIIGFGYSSISVGDVMLSLTAGINAVLHLVLIGIVCYKRNAYIKDIGLSACAKVNSGVHFHIDQIAHQMHDQRDERIKV